MAKKRKTNWILCLFALFIGAAGGFFGLTYFTLPLTDELALSEEIYFSNDPANGEVVTDVFDADISIHFLELGNKFSGDCTYIKTKEADILIDCGSKTNSISTVSSYLDKYVTDGTLEYVIVTHAHQDHYAGFATSEKVDSIFDLYDCEVIIDFARTNQKEMLQHIQTIKENCKTKLTLVLCITQPCSVLKKVMAPKVLMKLATE